MVGGLVNQLSHNVHGNPNCNYSPVVFHAITFLGRSLGFLVLPLPATLPFDLVFAGFVFFVGMVSTRWVKVDQL